mmetsp:Transcript_18954/g.52932  ORF Transcript_18954/g.52932 Transcript_18954/m.52932 type:complete len:211 (-) Transcript_18954:74-706(-)
MDVCRLTVWSPCLAIPSKRPNSSSMSHIRPPCRRRTVFRDQCSPGLPPRIFRRCHRRTTHRAFRFSPGARCCSRGAYRQCSTDLCRWEAPRPCSTAVQCCRAGPWCCHPCWDPVAPLWCVAPILGSTSAARRSSSHAPSLLPHCPAVPQVADPGRSQLQLGRMRATTASPRRGRRRSRGLRHPSRSGTETQESPATPRCRNGWALGIGVF